MCIFAVSVVTVYETANMSDNLLIAIQHLVHCDLFYRAKLLPIAVSICNLLRKTFGHTEKTRRAAVEALDLCYVNRKLTSFREVDHSSGWRVYSRSQFQADTMIASIPMVTQGPKRRFGHMLGLDTASCLPVRDSIDPTKFHRICVYHWRSEDGMSSWYACYRVRGYQNARMKRLSLCRDDASFQNIRKASYLFVSEGSWRYNVVGYDKHVLGHVAQYDRRRNKLLWSSSCRGL